GHEAAVQQHGGLVEGALDLAFEADVAALGAEVAAEQVGQLGGEDLPQPEDELALGGALEVGEVAVRLQERLLDEILGVDLALESLPDLDAGQQREVTPVDLEESPERGGVAGPGLPQQLFGIRRHVPALDTLTLSYQSRRVRKHRRACRELSGSWP